MLNAIAFGSLRDVARTLGKASSGQQRQRIQAVLALGENMGALSLYPFETYASYRHACRGKADRCVVRAGQAIEHGRLPAVEEFGV